MALHIPKMPPPSGAALRDLGTWLGHELPAHYLAFVREHDGARPQDNLLVTRDNEVGVRRFIPVVDVVREAQAIDGFPPKVLLLAEDGCGNYFYVEPLSGQVNFWDHEIEGPDEIVAPDVAEFVARLTPFETMRVTLAPGQLKQAWIDPEFLAKLKADDGS